MKPITSDLLKLANTNPERNPLMKLMEVVDENSSTLSLFSEVGLSILLAGEEAHAKLPRVSTCNKIPLKLHHILICIELHSYVSD